MITIDDLLKVGLRVGTVKAASPVEGSQKLLLLTVDLGEEERPIVSGIAKVYPPETLIGRQVVVVTELEPRTIFGIESRGMLLAADNQEGPVLLQPEQPVEPGSSIH